MSKLMRNRWLRWSLLSGVLSALGVGIYQVQEPEPRCVIASGKGRPIAFADEGRRLLTLPWADKITDIVGPLQVWDARSGAEIARYFDDGIGRYDLTKDGRYFVAELGKNDSKDAKGLRSFVRIDLANGDRAEFRIKDSEQTDEFSLSSDGRFLLRVCNRQPEAALQEDLPERLRVYAVSFQDESKQTLRVYDAATGQILLHCTTSDEAGWDRNDNLLYFIPQEGGGHDLQIWNPRTQATVARLKNVESRFSTPRNPVPLTGDLLLLEAIKLNGETTGRYVVWNSVDCKPQAEFEFGNGAFQNKEIRSLDGHWLAYPCSKDERSWIEVRDLTTGKVFGSIDHKGDPCEISPDGRFLTTIDAEGGLNLFHVSTGKLNWRKEPTGYPILFSRNGEFVFAVDPSSGGKGEFGCFECRTGRIRARIAPALTPGGMMAGPVFSFDVITSPTPDGRMLAVWSSGNYREPFLLKWVPWLHRFIAAPPSDVVAVFDAQACRERFRLEGWDTQSPMLSDDGRTLVTLHPGQYQEPRELRCWDVTAWKPLRWPIGIPASLAALCVLFTWWRNRRRMMAKNAGSG